MFRNIMLIVGTVVSRRSAVCAFSYYSRSSSRRYSAGISLSSSSTKEIVSSETTIGKLSASTNEICETTISSDGKAEVLCTVSNEDDRSSLWSDVAINAAKQFTISQRQKLKDMGALDIERPIRIIGTPVTDNCGLGDCVIDYDDTDSKKATTSTKTKIYTFRDTVKDITT